MKIYYVANARMPTERAHGVHIAKMCEAFSEAGVEVTLVIPKRKNPTRESLFEYYGIPRTFTVRYIAVFDFVGRPVFYWISQVSFTASLLFLSFQKKDTVVFTRDMLSGLVLSLRGFPVFFDMHGFPREFVWFWRIAMRRMKGMVLTNKLKLKWVKDVLGIPEEKLMVAPNGYDPKLFDIRRTQDELRKELGLPQNKKIALYTGHLYWWKGADILAEAAQFIPGALVVFVGGTDMDIARFKNEYKYTNLLFLGHKPYIKISKYLKAADVLVLPGTTRSKGKRASHAVYDMSPIKLFEYMASGVPVVAASLPSVSEVITDEEAYMCAPDNPQLLAQTIKKVLDYPHNSNTLARYAEEKAREFSWEMRARRIIDFINKRV